jgi:hypothetical protein
MYLVMPARVSAGSAAVMSERYYQKIGHGYLLSHLLTIRDHLRILFGSVSHQRFKQLKIKYNDFPLA